MGLFFRLSTIVSETTIYLTKLLDTASETQTFVDDHLARPTDPPINLSYMGKPPLPTGQKAQFSKALRKIPLPGQVDLMKIR